MISFDKKMDLLKKMNSMRRDRSQNTPNIVSDLTPYQREVRKNILVEFRERQQKGKNVILTGRLRRLFQGRHISEESQLVPLGKLFYLSSLT